jgi:hypothetical protein
VSRAEVPHAYNGKGSFNHSADGLPAKSLRTTQVSETYMIMISARRWIKGVLARKKGLRL